MIVMKFGGTRSLVSQACSELRRIGVIEHCRFPTDVTGVPPLDSAVNRTARPAPRRISIVDSPSPTHAFTCRHCGSTRVKLATDAIYVVYLRCEDCFQVWSISKQEYLRIRREQERDDLH